MDNYNRHSPLYLCRPVDMLAGYFYWEDELKRDMNNTENRKGPDDFCLICPICDLMFEHLITEFKPQTGLQPAKKETQYIECKNVPRYGKQYIDANTECPQCETQQHNPLWRVSGINITTGERRFLKTELWVRQKTAYRPRTAEVNI